MKSAIGILSIFIVLVLCSCSQVSGKKALEPWTDKVDIYVAGDYNDASVYWKNGEIVYLTKPESFSHASAITVSDNDVYVAGYVLLPNKNPEPNGPKPAKGELVVVDTGSNHYKPTIAVALYWKNNKPVMLTDSTADTETTGIAVSGHDVYVSGFEYNGKKTDETDHGRKAVAKYWKNGVAVVLTDGSHEARALSIFVKDADVYVTGYEEVSSTVVSNNLHAIRYWKNGKSIDLTVEKHLSDNNDFSEGHSIFVDGKNVYIAGTQSGIATYWKNGLPVKLVKGENLHQTGKIIEPVSSTATSIVVSGSDIYVAGTQDTLSLQNSEAKYWKNGKEQTLTHAPEDLYGDVFLSICGKNAYITTGLRDGSDELVAKLWKNNSPAILIRGTGDIGSICVIQKPAK